MNRARARAYALLSRLLLEPLDEAMLGHLHDLPVLSDALGEEPDLDELAAEHHALLAMAAPPYEGAFLDEEGLVGGSHAAGLHDLYSAFGFAARRRDTSADHLGVTLGALAFLSGAAADAHEDDETSRLRLIEGHILAVTDRHLLRWLPAFFVAVQRNGRGFWATVVELILALVVEHRSSLGALPSPVEPLPGPRPLLDEEKTSIRSIARFLTTPCQAGTLLSRADIGAMSHELQVPRGFGSRINMLENVLKAAAEYDNFPSAVDSVTSAIAQHLAALGDLRESYPSLSPWIAPWQLRLAQSRALLADMRASAVAHPAA